MIASSLHCCCCSFLLFFLFLFWLNYDVVLSVFSDDEAREWRFVSGSRRDKRPFGGRNAKEEIGGKKQKNATNIREEAKGCRRERIGLNASFALEC